MARGARVGRDLIAVRELAHSIDVIGARSRRSDFLAAFVRDARSVLGLDSVLCYGLRESAFGNQELSYLNIDGLDEDAYRASFSSFVESQSVNWAVFNTTRPERTQRNRPFVWTADEVGVLAQTGLSPVARVLYPKVGTDRQAQIRVVICDGPSMLGWFGGWQRTTIDPRQHELLRVLVPALGRRLKYERLTRDRAGRHLDAVLDALGSAAVVTDCAGRVRELNAAARVMIHDDPRAFRAEIVEAARAERHPRWSITRTVSESGAGELLLVARAAGSTASRVARAVGRWGLTSRQRDVLAEVVDGHANQTIAAILGISERTVEVHLTALFERAAVDNRATLIASVFSLR
jgi:DNA-binding CsgD family transcriptional regulator